MRIKRSREIDLLTEELTDIYNFYNESVITRIAYVTSLSNGKIFDENEDKLGSDGKELRDMKSVFGTSQSGKSYFPIYKSLLDQHYERQINESDFEILFKLHLLHGLKYIKSRIDESAIVNGEHVTLLANLVSENLSLLEEKETPVNISEIENKEFPSYDGLVDFVLGKNGKGEDVEIRLNDLDEFDSHHMAIAGTTGAGKTQLIKDILFQISRKTDKELKYIFFDYKGGGSKDELDYFLKETSCEFIDLLEDEFNFNPLEFISLSNERKQSFEIQSFIDSINAIEPKIGVKQSHYLKQIVTSLFSTNKHPTLNDIDSELKSFYEEEGKSPDSLLSVIDSLSSGLFNKPLGDKGNIYDRSLYLNLPNTIADTTRQLCVFLILKYLLAEFSKSEDTRPTGNENIKPLRYVVVIDEAHVYLGNKNARKILEDLLRVIRSKGVVIILLTQGIEDFKKKGFDFSSQIKIPICLDVKEKNLKSLTNFLGTATSKNKFEKAIAGLKSGKAIVNFKEPELIEIKQFYNRLK